MMKKVIIFILLSILHSIFNASQAVTLNVTNGRLTGAGGLEIYGDFYTVEFMDGSCESLFESCYPGAFAFRRVDIARTAARVLFNEVFIDGDMGLFDSNPQLTTGCADETVCVVHIPFAWGAEGVVITSFAANYSQEDYNESTPDNYGFDFIGNNTPRKRSFDFSFKPDYTYAVFRRMEMVSSVPEPGMLWLIGIGFIGLYGIQRSLRRS